MQPAGTEMGTRIAVTTCRSQAHRVHAGIVEDLACLGQGAGAFRALVDRPQFGQRMERCRAAEFHWRLYIEQDDFGDAALSEQKGRMPDSRQGAVGAIGEDEKLDHFLIPVEIERIRFRYRIHHAVPM